MNTVGEILKNKGGGSVWYVTPNMTVYQTLEVMAAHDVGAMLVMDGPKLIGIFSERDYARKVVLKGRSSRQTPVAELMATKVYYVSPDATDSDCMHLMTTKRVRHLPVLHGDNVIGVVSVGDIMKSVLREQEFQIEQLERYITGPAYPEATQ